MLSHSLIINIWWSHNTQQDTSDVNQNIRRDMCFAALLSMRIKYKQKIVQNYDLTYTLDVSRILWINTSNK